MTIRIVNTTRGKALGEAIVLAESWTERLCGLLGCRHPVSGSGMLLPRTWAIHTWFMRFPIDAVFLNETNRVVGTRQGLKPFKMAGCWRATAVLELPAGTITATGTRAGDALALTEPGGAWRF